MKEQKANKHSTFMGKPLTVCPHKRQGSYRVLGERRRTKEAVTLKAREENKS